MTVGELMDRMTAAEFTEWAVFDSMHGPIGPDRHDVGFATVAGAVFTAAGAKNVKLAEFMPLVRKRHVQSDESMRANFGAFKRAIEKRRAKNNGNNR